ncbi:MAG: hypothetical protein J6C61_03325 [Clostridia bacterium]|nr:hypothetical protein [Clostridia bacterium]
MEEIKKNEATMLEENPALDEQFETKEIPFEDYEPSNVKKSKKKEEKTFGLASLVFGVLAIISNFVMLPMSAYFPFVGVFFAIADKVKNKRLTHFGFSGLVCSIVAYAINVVCSIIAFLFLIAYTAILIVIMTQTPVAA